MDNIMKNNGYLIDSFRSIFGNFKRGFDLRYRIYRLKWVLYPKLLYISKFPLCLNVEVSSFCNLKCTMCYNNDVDFQKGVMDFDLYKKIIDEGSKYKLNSVKLSWRGEPLLNKNIVDMIKYAKDRGILEVFLNTNGLLLNDKLSEQLIDSGLDMILFSVDGVTKETYEKIRIGGNYDIMVNNIKKFLEIKKSKNKPLPHTRIYFTKTPENKHEVDLLFKKWNILVDEIFVNPALPLQLDHSTKSKLNFDIKERKFCSHLCRRLAITWNGDMAICCIDWKPSIVLGNVKTDTIYSVWHGEELDRIRCLHRKKSLNDIKMCKDCASFDSYVMNNEDYL